MDESLDDQEEPVNTDAIRSMLAHIRVIRYACDLDLLMFFYRHPCALLSVEQVAAQVGYARERVEESLDALIDSGLLKHSESPSHAARLYALQLGSAPGEQVTPILQIAATHEGRRKVMRLLASGRDDKLATPVLPLQSRMA